MFIKKGISKNTNDFFFWNIALTQGSQTGFRGAIFRVRGKIKKNKKHTSSYERNKKIFIFTQFFIVY
jgi:hypothetical protein